MKPFRDKPLQLYKGDLKKYKGQAGAELCQAQGQLFSSIQMGLVQFSLPIELCPGVGGWVVGLIEIKATQPSWGLGMAELGNNMVG